MLKNLTELRKFYWQIIFAQEMRFFFVFKQNVCLYPRISLNVGYTFEFCYYPPPPAESRRLLKITEKTQEIQQAELGSSGNTSTTIIWTRLISWQCYSAHDDDNVGDTTKQHRRHNDHTNIHAPYCSCSLRRHRS